MKQYVVGVLDFFNNYIDLRKVEANDELEAAWTHPLLTGYEFDCDTVEELDGELSNCDMTVSVIEI